MNKKIFILILIGLSLSIGCTTQQQYQPSVPQTQSMVVFNMTIQVSKGWQYPIDGGYTYEIQMTSNLPVVLTKCEEGYVSASGSSCSGYDIYIVKSTTSFTQSVYLEPSIKYIQISNLRPGSSATVHLKITRTS